MKPFFCIIFLLVFPLSAIAGDNILDGILPNKNIKYIIELKNGDILSGYVVEMVSDPEEGDGIKFSTELGNATIYEDQIANIQPEQIFYRHNHRIFLLPTAEPIENNHFIGNFELLFFYAGVGISDIVSITAGRSFIPNIRSDQQLSVINTKISLLETPIDGKNTKLSFALGANLGFINHNNRMLHYYGVGTLTLNRSAVTAAVFYKGGGKDIYDVKMGTYTAPFLIKYADGSFGMALGLDTKFSSFHNLHFIGELWNSDVTKPTNTGVLLGLRLCSTKFSADFGMSFFTQPFVAPFCSFVWTPFSL